MRRRPNYETDEQFEGAFTVAGYGGIAWHVLGWETEPDEDTEWSGYEVRTGQIVAMMIGDDRKFVFDRDEITPLQREDYCGECGQIGCAHDGLDRDEVSQ